MNEKKAIHSRSAKLIIDCSVEQKKKIEILAAEKEMSITDFLLTLVEEKYSWCPLNLSHEPNEKTLSSIKKSEKGEGTESFKSVDALLDNLEI